MPKINPSQIQDHMDVITVHNETIGKVDHMQDGKIKLTKNDSPDGLLRVTFMQRLLRHPESLGCDQ